jgi:hypothetical protein
VRQNKLIDSWENKDARCQRKVIRIGYTDDKARDKFGRLVTGNGRRYPRDTIDVYVRIYQDFRRWSLLRQ